MGALIPVMNFAPAFLISSAIPTSLGNPVSGVSLTPTGMFTRSTTALTTGIRRAGESPRRLPAASLISPC